MFVATDIENHITVYIIGAGKTLRSLGSSENRLDGKLCRVSGHFCICWPRLEAIGSMQYLGQDLHIPGRDQKGVRVTQNPMNRLINSRLGFSGS